jgi:Flp pilus assembly CpaF family ATPase
LIWINEPTKVFVARAGVHELTTTVLSEDQVRDLVEKMLKSSGRRVDLRALLRCSIAGHVEAGPGGPGLVRWRV